MANKKRFRIGNTTVNLGQVHKVTDEILCRYPTNVCQYYTHSLIECPYYTKIPTLTICKIHNTDIHCQNRTGINCTNTFRGCGFSIPDPRTPIIDDFDINIIKKIHPTQIKEIKENLLSQLKEIEEHEIALKKMETPQTLEEINELEDELENSLKEIKNLKRKFKK